MKDIILFIPPAYEMSAPPLGTPTLVGYLKAHGLSARQQDLNVLYWDHIRKKRDFLFSEAYMDERVARKVYYRGILRYEKEKGRAYEFEYNPGSSFAFTEKMLSSKVLFRYLADGEENPFVGFFRTKILPIIRKGFCRTVGFSVTAPSQVIATFTFCHLLKRELPEIRIVLGGQWVSFYQEALRKRRDFTKLFDFLIFFEGETPLLNLLQALKDQRPLSEVPNLIYRNGDRWKTGRHLSEEDMDLLPAPDFTGLQLQKYLESAGGMTLTMETSRGCYWNRCVFCIDLPLPKLRYREKSPHLVVRDMKHLIAKYGARRLLVSNATFSARQMREVSRLILSEGIRISWWTMARFDDDFDRETLRLTKSAGCSMIGFGLESFNQRVLDFIKKGTRREIIERIIRDAHDLGLPIYFQTMIGIPSERMEEALDTIEFLSTFPSAAISLAAFNIYYLIPKNAVFMHPEKFGIEILPHERLPFRYFYPFRHRTGNINAIMSAKLIRLYESLQSRWKLQPGQERPPPEYLSPPGSLKA